MKKYTTFIKEDKSNNFSMNYKKHLVYIADSINKVKNELNNFKNKMKIK